MANGNGNGQYPQDPTERIQPIDSVGASPASPAPITPDNAPAPQAPPPPGPGSMQPFPLGVGPPRDEDHFNERKAGWKRMFEAMTTNPALTNALMSFGTQAMQPTIARGAGAQVGALGRGLESAAATYGATRQQQLAEAEQQRKAGLEERRVGAEEARVGLEKERTGIEKARSAAEVRHLNQESDKLKLEIANLPQAQREQHELRMKEIDNAIKQGDVEGANLKLKELEWGIKSSPAYRQAELDRIQAEIAESKARMAEAEARKGGVTPQERLARFYQSPAGGGYSPRDAAMLSAGRGTGVTVMERRRNAQSAATDLRAQFDEEKPKDTRTGKPLTFDAFVRKQFADPNGEYAGPQNVSFRSDIRDVLSGKTLTDDESGTDAGPGLDEPVTMKEIEETARATGRSVEQVTRDVLSKGLKVQQKSAESGTMGGAP